MKRRALIAVLAVTAMALVGLVAYRASRAQLSEPGYVLPEGATPSQSVFMEELTWVEVRDRIKAGHTTVLIPTGGTEQNGPHMVLGKHNYIVKETARRIAEKLGNTLVAPVMAYVPEGDPESKSGHMRFSGTISVSENVFFEALVYSAESLKAHGFELICFVGDSGGNQSAQERAAKTLNERWKNARALHVSDYYLENGQVEALVDEGESLKSIGTHAGIRDTSELLAVYPDGIRKELLAPSSTRDAIDTGVIGDPTKASKERGEKLLDLKVEAAVRQIQNASGR